MGTSEAETSVSGKAECLFAKGKDQKSKLSGVSFSFKNLSYKSDSYCEGLVIRFDLDKRKIKMNDRVNEKHT